MDVTAVDQVVVEIPRSGPLHGGYLKEIDHPLSVLIVEDEPDDAALLDRELRNFGYETSAHRVDTEEGFLGALSTPPDIILADFTLPQFNALRALQLLQARRLDVPFVVVTGTTGEDRAVEVMREGADDYLLKDRLARLGPAVARALGEKRLQAENRRAEKNRRHLEAQLRQAQRMEAIGLLASGVAHDFNNILTVIHGQCDLVLHHASLETRDRERLEEISRAADRAASLTRQLLAFSRRQVLQPSVLDLNSVLNDMNRMLVRVLGEDIVIQTEPGCDLGHVKADRGQIEQVVVNLVVNARDAMPRGGKLTLCTENVVANGEFARAREGLLPGEYVMLSIADRGEGMEKEVLDRIFEPFYTTKELGRGTGLGLSTVYGIVKQSNGFIYVSSEPSVGTTFEVLVPKVDEPLTSLSVEPLAPAQGDGKVFLVEDDGAIRALAREFLELAGFSVVEAEGGREALSALEAEGGNFDLVITDLVMPGMGGDEFADLLAARYPRIKVLYTSGHLDRPIAVPLERGYRELIRKPFKSRELVQKVIDLLGAESERLQQSRSRYEDDEPDDSA